MSEKLFLYFVSKVREVLNMKRNKSITQNANRVVHFLSKPNPGAGNAGDAGV